MHHRHQLISRLEEKPLSELFVAQRESNPSIKCLFKLFHQRFSTPEFGHALQDLARDAASIGCPQVLSYEEVGLWENRLAAIRPYVEGYALDDVIRRLYSKEVVLTSPLGLYLVAETAHVVAQAHDKGLMHGAIDSSNVLLGFDGGIRVSGFGMMRAVGASEALRVVAPKLHKSFRAPEQRDPCQAAAASDVYALGCIAYELLTLTNVSEVRGGGLSTKRDTLVPPSRLNRRINARIDPVIMRSLDLVPSRRYPNASQFAEALRSLFALIGSAVGPQELARFSREVFPNEVSLSSASSFTDSPIQGFFSLTCLSGEAATSTMPTPAAVAQQSACSRDVVHFSESSDLGISEQQLFDEAFGEELQPEEEPSLEEERRRRSKQETTEAPVVRPDVLLAPLDSIDNNALAEAMMPPALELSEHSEMLPPNDGHAPPASIPAPVLGESLLAEIPVTSEPVGSAADPLASWEAPAGPISVGIRRMSLPQARMNEVPMDAPTNSESNTGLKERPEPGAGVEEVLSVQTSMPDAPPENSTSGMTSQSQGEASGKALQEEVSWNAFASPKKPSLSHPAKKNESARASVPGEPLSLPIEAERGKTETDWHIPPQPELVPTRRSRWGLWTIAVGCALGLACVAVLGLLKREPATAGLSKEALQRIGGAFENKVSTAYLSIETNAPAMVIIDGKKSPIEAPFDRMELPAGRHIVRLVRGDEVREFGLILEQGQHEKRIEKFTSTFSDTDTKGEETRRTRKPRSPKKNTVAK